MRRSFRSLLLVLVVLAVGLVVWRIASGPEIPVGQAGLRDMNTFRLYGQTVTLDAPARVAVEAVGSVGATDTLEATAWLLDAASRRTVWAMDAKPGKRLAGTLVRTSDTLDLPAGTYELYFSTLGTSRRGRSLVDRVFSREAQWRNDAGRWYVTLATVGGGTLSSERLNDERLVTGRLAENASDVGDDSTLLWRARSAHDENTATFLAADSAVLRLDVLGLPTMSVVVKDDDDRVVWELDRSALAPVERGFVSGSLRVPLPAGTYRMDFDPDGAGPGDWPRHPPLDPGAWGLKATAEQGRLVRFDPFTSLTKVVEIQANRGSGRWTVPFEVLRETRVVVAAMGEITSQDNAYDTGGLYGQDGSTVWELTYDDSDEAGGVSKNRKAVRTLTLAPGHYEARFHTDDSHHYEGWNSESSAPDHPERWGISVFAFQPEDVRAGQASAQASLESSASSASSGEVLAAIENVRNDDDDEARFVLDEAGMVHVRAAAEAGGDDVWITNAQGATLWTIESEPAKDGWRIVNRRLELPAGEYTAHVRADGSKAAVTFAEETGRPRSEYGIRVSRVK